MNKETSLETNLEKLNDIIAALEAGSTTLEESVKLYEKGKQLVERCQKQLNGYKGRIEVIKTDGGEPEA